MASETTACVSETAGMPGSGVAFKLGVDHYIPLYIYKNTGNFVEHMTQHVTDMLKYGLYGLEVTDCVVSMTDCSYYTGDGTAKPISDTPRTTAAHFRILTPLVLRTALERAGTVICEPICRFTLEIPSEAFSTLLSVLAKLRAIPKVTEVQGEVYVLTGDIPSAHVHDLQQQLPNLTGGEGLLEYELDRYEARR